MSMTHRMRLRRELVRTIAVITPDSDDKWRMELAAAIEDLIDAKISEAFENHSRAHQLGL